MHIEPALPSDAAELARLIDIAGEGIPAYLWSQLAGPGETAMDIGTQRAARDNCDFCYRNAHVIRAGDQLAGMILAYPLDDPYDAGDLNEIPEIVHPLIRLEALVPGSWYINALATDEAFRGRGIGSLLMEESESIARRAGFDRFSLIVASDNSSAKQLYRKLGYNLVSSEPVVDYPGAPHGGDWELMVKVSA